MSDPRMQSIHLGCLPRREEFRRARARLQQACGEHTLAGHLCDLPDSGRPPDVPTFVHVDGEVCHPRQVRCYLEGEGAAYPLHVGLNSAGRLPDNDIVLPDAAVSRRHFAIVVHSDLSCELHDTASKNGTCLNGKRITAPARLVNGDEIVVCDRRLRFRMTVDPITPPSVDQTIVE